MAEHQLDGQGRIQLSQRYERDRQGRVVRQWQERAGQGKSAVQNVMTFSYADANSNEPRRIERPSVVPGKTQAIEIEYNARGQIVSVTERGWRPAVGQETAPTALQRTTTYRYSDLAGVSMLVEMKRPGEWINDEIDPKTKAIISRAYNGYLKIPAAALAAESKQLKSLPWQNSVHSTPGLQIQRGSAWSATQDEILELRYADRTALRVFDDFKRVVAIKNPGQGWQYVEYGSHGKITQHIDPIGRKQRFSYDEQSRLTQIQKYLPAATQVSEVVRLHWQGPHISQEMVQDEHGTRQLDIRRDTSGRELQNIWTIRTAEGHTKSWTIEYQYHVNGQRQARTIIDGTGKLSTFIWDYDAQQRVSALKLSRRWLPDIVLAESMNWHSSETGLFTLLGWKAKPGNMAVQGQSPNNTALTAPWAELVSDVPQKIAESSDLPKHLTNGLAPSLPQDASGLPESVITQVGLVRLQWDASGRLSKTTQPDGSTTQHIYDARGRRIAKIYTHQQMQRPTYYLYDSVQVVGIANQHGQLQQHIAHTGWRPVAMVQTQWSGSGWWDRLRAWWQPETKWLETDRVGAVTAVVKADGQKLPVTSQPLRLVGQIWDEETGLAYHGARFFVPDLSVESKADRQAPTYRQGRFLSPDPVGIRDVIVGVEPEHVLDLYAYVGGQAAWYFDPDGAARVRYYAIDDNRRLDANKMPNAGHWAFVVYGIAGHEDKVFVYDRGGSYFARGVNPYALVTAASGADQAIQELQNHYRQRGGYYSPDTFDVDWSDDQAKQLIRQLTGTDLGGSTCTATLPTIHLGVQGVLNPTATRVGGKDLRLIACPANATPEQIRWGRMQQAIARHESKDNDCQRVDRGCEATTYNPARFPAVEGNARRTQEIVPASYGWHQFTIMRYLDILNGFTAQQLQGMGIDPADVRAARQTGASALQWVRRMQQFDYIRPRGLVVNRMTRDWNRDRDAFMRDTGYVVPINATPAQRQAMEADARAQYERMFDWQMLLLEVEQAVGPANTPRQGDPVEPDIRRTCNQRHVGNGGAQSRCIWGALRQAHELARQQDPAAVTPYSRIEALRERIGATQVQLNPYLRNVQWAESFNGFYNAFALREPARQQRLLSIFTDPTRYQRLRDAHFSQVIPLAARSLRLDPAAALTPAQEEALMERVGRTHNGGQPISGVVGGYIADVEAYRRATICVAAQGQTTYIAPGHLEVRK